MGNHWGDIYLCVPQSKCWGDVSPRPPYNRRPCCVRVGQVYMKRHAYGSATTDHLWQALSSVSRSPIIQHSSRFTLVTCWSSQWRRQGEGGSFPPYGWTSKNYVICVCFHCHGTSSYTTTNTLQGRRAKSHVDTQTIQPGLGDFVL